MMAWRLRLLPNTDRREKGILRFEFDPEDRPLAVDLVRAWRDRWQREVARSQTRGGEVNVPWLVATIAFKREQRSLDQNSLLRGLERILAAERYDSDRFIDVVHEDLLDLYGPEQVDEQGEVMKLTSGRAAKKRSHELDTAEFSRLIEAAFMELAVAGVGLDRAQQIANYWKEWRSWRKHRNALTYKSLDEYRQRQPFCERCVFKQAEHIAHIWPRSLKGPDEAWNVLHLCADCHVMAPESQHETGWVIWCRSAPHLLDKVNEARGRGQLSEIKVEAA